MGKWTSEVTLEPIDFDGDMVTFTVKRMLAADMGIVVRHYTEKKDGTGKLSFASINELAAVIGEVFPKYLIGISGMTKADGTPFTVAEFSAVAGENYFAPLAANLMTKLMRISTVGGDELKNSSAPVPVPSAGSGEQVNAISVV